MKRRDKFQPVDEQGGYLSGPELYQVAREIAGDTIILAFSRGKDSIAMWLELREHFTVIPYYCYMVPGGLSYEVDSLAYYEEFFGTKIYRFLHYLFWDNVNGFLYQPPTRARRIIEAGIPEYSYIDLARGLATQHGLDNPYVAFGYRLHDSPRRRLLVYREGPMGRDNYRYLWAIWNWNIERVAEKIKGAGVALPVDYQLFGWTLTATDYQYARVIRDELPEDWEKLKFWYPLIDAEMFRHEQVGK